MCTRVAGAGAHRPQPQAVSMMAASQWLHNIIHMTVGGLVLFSVCLYTKYITSHFLCHKMDLLTKKFKICYSNVNDKNTGEDLGRGVP